MYSNYMFGEFKMKINKIFLVGIILLTVITIGAVSAAEDIGALTDDNDDSLSTTDEIDLQTADDAVVGEDKKTWEIDPTNNKEELNVSSLSINFGNSAPLKYNDDGEITNADEFSLMIDGKPHEIDYMDTEWFSVDINDLALGEHNYMLNFAGNDEYLPANGTGTFKVCDVVVEIPDKYVYGEQLDCSVVVSTPTDAGTTVGVTINGKTITKKIEYEYYYEENHGTYQVTYLSLKEFNLACGVHDLTVTLDGKTIRNGKITVDYNLPYDSYSEPYGEDQFTLYVLDDMDEAKVTVKIDGKVASLSHIRTIPDMKFLAVSLPKNFAAGNHNLTVSYAGDKKYPARTFNTTLRIEPTLVAPYRVPEGTGGFTLKMPEDAKGNLIIFIREAYSEEKYTVFANVSAAGDVFVSVANLSVGDYEFDFKYEGNDGYKIYSYDSTFEINPKITLPPAVIKDGEKAYVSVDLPGKEGYLAARIEMKEGGGNSAELVNGKATVEVPFLTQGKNSYFAELFIKTGHDDDGDYDYGNTYYYDFDITIEPNMTLPKQITLGDDAIVSINAPGLNGTLTVGDKTVNLTDGKATIALSDLSEGKHSFKAHLSLMMIDEFDIEINKGEFDYAFDVEVVNPITAKDASPLYSANEKYSVKVNGNRKVTFYILDGSKQILKKSVDIKNGVATLTYKITQGVKTYNIKTVFNKASVTKKLTVKHVVTLKSLKVKKSAKKIIIQNNCIAYYNISNNLHRIIY